ncbi:hypothetical protein BDQ17DRAFT_1332305 [Cyathus striatus]|nr:hypothetical protein BDQ17DRAFT_1332305 [Cyathus striatus]
MQWGLDEKEKKLSDLNHIHADNGQINSPTVQCGHTLSKRSLMSNQLWGQHKATVKPQNDHEYHNFVCKVLGGGTSDNGRLCVTKLGIFEGVSNLQKNIGRTVA